MNDLLSTPMHVLCIAGPDAGVALPVLEEGVQLGRQMGLIDRFTSRLHLLVKPQRTRGGELVEVVDLGSSNGFSVGRLVALLPGFARNWAWLKSVPEARKRGGGGARASLAPGQVFLAGSNLWQVRRRPQTMSLQDALEHEGAPSVNRRAFLFALPALSLLWIVGRYFGWVGAAAFLGLAILIGLYVWRAVKSRRAPRPRWNLLYGLGLPARGARANEEASAEAGAGAGSEVHGRQTGRPGASPVRSRAASIDGWQLDLSPAPSVTKKVFRIPFVAARTLVRTRFRAGPSIKVREGDSIALSGSESWAEWVLAQALLYARNDGLNAAIHASDPHTLTVAGTALLSVVQPGFPADHRVECGGRPLRVKLPLADETQAGGIPASVHVRELPPPSASTGLAVPIGRSAEGPVVLDLVREGPHALVAGTTGSGKSVALRTWILQMCKLREPSKLRLVLIDYKGGAAFRDLARLPHAEGLLTDLEPEETARAVAGLSAELLAREEELAARGFASVDEWEAVSPADSPARIVCVIDEFRAMVRTHPETLEDLVDLAARGRSLGIHLIAATQSPGGVVTPAMRANLTLRVCLRTA
ncbi:MAG: FtsK/SpoIIIE domain-containing protein, partial [Actinomycetaceae bacterium]|nr:FtsK/SpoIIIE domain-containing protein [Actinomycetaceae bacterium]